MSGVSKECASDDKGSVQGFLAIMVFFGVIHCSFAYYLQRRLVWDMQKDENEGARLSTLVWEILKRDVPFCLYFFFAIGSFGVACWGQGNASSTGKCGDKVQMGTGGVVGLAVAYGLLSPCYGCCFVCGVATKDTVKDVKAKTDKVGKACKAEGA